MDRRWTMKNDNEEPKIVVIGGGTGLSILLRGLKLYTPNITAIVTVADDGGSSGVLREDLGILPPGDIRDCLIALANMEPKLKKLFQYRFNEGILKGQNFGNLFIAAMNGIHGSFEMAIKETSNVLAITGKVLPMTLDKVKIYAELENGMIVKGESVIPSVSLEQNSPIKKVYIEPLISRPMEDGIRAIKEADLIVLGPGSLYTSIIPNLLVNDISQNIYDSKAKKIYISNIMTQAGETENYSITKHVQALLDHSMDNILDYIIVNTETIPEDFKNEYIMENSTPVVLTDEDIKFLNSKKIQIVEEELFYVYDDYIRHDYIILSEIIMSIFNSNNNVKKNNS